MFFEGFTKPFHPVFTWHNLYVPLNVYNVDIKKSDRICSSTFVVDDISRLFLDSSIISIKETRSTKTIVFYQISGIN